MISPRLDHLLRLLLAADQPVPIDDLAVRLSVSSRTVARELASADQALRPCGVAIGSQAGKGLCLTGPPERIERLRAELSRARAAPSSRSERRWRLALEVLTNPNPPKLVAQARRLGVSPATIGLDLDAIALWLPRFGLELVRRPGQAIALDGPESGRRSALGEILSQLGPSPEGRQVWPEAAVWEGVDQVLAGPGKAPLAHLTPESAASLRRYLAVTVQRLRQGHRLEAVTAEAVPDAGTTGESATSREAVTDEDSADASATNWAGTAAPGPEQRRAADTLAEALAQRFGLNLPPPERHLLALRLTAARLAHGVAGDEAPPPTADPADLRLVYRLIEAFDPQEARLLKLDDDLVYGLVAHLRALRVRLAHQFEIEDPLFDQLARDYPEVLARSRRALAVLRRDHPHIPEAEASFLAAHFGAAGMRAQERRERRRKLRLGVLCAHGIGTSYLLISQLRHHFADRATAELCPVDGPPPFDRFDLIVTTVPGDDPRLLQVSPILGETDRRLIAAALDQARDRPDRAAPTAGRRLAQASRAIQQLSGAVAAVLEGFDVVPVEAAIGLDDLFKTIGYRCGHDAASGAQIYHDLAARQRLSDQVIPELAIALFHARSAGVAQPGLVLFNPDGGRFLAPGLAGVRQAVVMLAPIQTTVAALDLMGRISAWLVDQPEFLAAVQAGRRETVSAWLERLAEDQLIGLTQDLLDQS
ncbi:MAG: PRD domain-containing protein [Propionibacteriaceae bacterium]|nr:PRD domain-containing protein [Propionibacteriaceae bacterium]